MQMLMLFHGIGINTVHLQVFDEVVFYINVMTSPIISFISNRLASCMLASGSDDGAISIFDLRLLKVCKILFR